MTDESHAYRWEAQAGRWCGTVVWLRSRTAAWWRTVKRLSVFLSGGNPPIATGDGDAPVQAYIAALSGWLMGRKSKR